MRVGLRSPAISGAHQLFLVFGGQLLLARSVQLARRPTRHGQLLLACFCFAPIVLGVRPSPRIVAQAQHLFGVSRAVPVAIPQKLSAVAVIPHGARGLFSVSRGVHEYCDFRDLCAGCLRADALVAEGGKSSATSSGSKDLVKNRSCQCLVRIQVPQLSTTAT